MPFEHPIDFPLGDPKERVLRSIRESLMSRFEVNRKFIEAENVTGESYQISCQYGIAAYAADFRDKAEAVIWDEIMKIIR